jgi:hypothetical protein
MLYQKTRIIKEIFAHKVILYWEMEVFLTKEKFNDDMSDVDFLF